MVTVINQALGSPSDGVVGSISTFAGRYAPAGTIDCAGQLLPIENHVWDMLYSIIGTMYGGNGESTFALPDLRPTDKDGNKVDWTEAGIPRQVICGIGTYPSRS